MALSQLKELGEQAIVAVAASLVDGGAVLKAQLIASRFYEALRHELEESSTDDPSEPRSQQPVTDVSVSQLQASILPSC